MVKKARRPLRTADSDLPVSVTRSFIERLTMTLSHIPGEEFEATYLHQQLLTKYVDGSASGNDERRRRAIEKWLDVERTNEQTNDTMDRIHRNDVFYDPERNLYVDYDTFYSKVAEIVRQVIGASPSLHYRHGGFSGGASTSKNRRHSHPAVKFLDRADTTRPALALFHQITRGTRWADYINDSGLEPRIVRGNVLFTVPKNDKIDRVAAKEPDLNMFLQKLFGNQIRYLLRRKGVDLNDQTRNQELARKGSIDGRLMTIDLSSASDSVTYGLVKRVLPEDWFYYLDTVRSPVTLIDGVEHRCQMFSSMGNGFTFELESLLFYAITRATAYFHGVRGTISVYGDDIVAPSSLYEPLVRALECSGFRVNPDKSHHEGAFRESCGKHWYGGRDVSPFFIRGPFRRVSDLILTLNQLTGWASRTLGIVDPRFEAIILEFRKYVPEHLWGGQDLTSRTSLVTGHRPRKELIYPVETIPHDHIGGMLFWLFLAEPRETGSHGWDALTTFGSSPPRYARVRKNRQWWTDVPIFLSEYGV